MNPHILILYFGLVAIFCASQIYGFSGADDRKCKYTKNEKGLRVRCYNLNLKEVPQYLTTGVDVLDLSYNRIKKLKKSSFLRYSGIEYLLIYDNMIHSIEPETFTSLTSLQEIDLSNNALTTIPLEIFQLPSLRNLYVDSNDLMNLKSDLKKLKTPIQAPLEYLNIAECGLSEIPDLGMLPRIWHLNASQNPLEFIGVQQLASMCNLKSVDLAETEIPNCACQSIKKYLKYLGIKTDYLIDCDTEGEMTEAPCPPDLVNATMNSTEFRECHVATPITVSKLWFFVGGGIAGFLLVITCLILWRRSRRTKQLKRKSQPEILENCTDQHLLRAKESP